MAESDGRVVGFGELITHPDEARMRHVGEVNMVATHADWTGKGVGRALLEAMLYERLGFAIEGTMPRMGFGADAGPPDGRSRLPPPRRAAPLTARDQVSA